MVGVSVSGRWAVAVLLLGALVVFSVHAVEYQSDRLNLAPGMIRNHFQWLSQVTGNITVTIPSGFNLTNASQGGNVTSVNVTWIGISNALVNYTLQGPSSCSENALVYSDVYINGSLFYSFPFYCTADINIVDFKIEYGHGSGNYLGLGDYLVIPNRSAVLFNLARIYNLGYILEPNENPENASLFCEYELLPIRTFGRGQVRRGPTRVNMSYFWSEIRSGYWFRLGVMSQTITPRPPGNRYNVSCTNLTYQFAHTRVQAPFTNYSLEVRSERPFSIAQYNDTADLTKRLYVVQNTERYGVYSLKFVFVQSNATAIFEHPQLLVNQSLIFRVDGSNRTNLTIFFVPSWFRHSTDPDVLTQSDFFGEPYVTPDNPPVLLNPGNQTGVVNSAFSLQLNGSDPEGLNVTWRTNSTLFNVSITGLIQFTPNGSSIGNFTILVNLTDPGGNLNRTLFNIEIVSGQRAPALLNPGNKTAVVNNSFSLQINASDPEGSTVTYMTNSTLFTISSAGLISFMPNTSSVGNHSILVNVSDTVPLTNSTIFNLEILAPVRPPDINITSAGFGPSEGNLSTNFSNIDPAQITNVSGMQLGNKNGSINWSFSSVNANRAGDIIAQHVRIGQGFVHFNTSAFDSSFNQSARITLYNTTCPQNNKVVVYFGDGGVNLSTIQSQGTDCLGAGVCANVTCSSGASGLQNVSFTVLHFTSFASGGNANLTIENSGPILATTVGYFNATYVNASSGALISGAICNITVFDELDRNDNMSQTARVYIFNKSITLAGTFGVNVWCSASGFTALNARDNITVVSLSNTSANFAGSTGGGGSGAAYRQGKGTASRCKEDWDCTPWSPCLSGKRSRACHDKNNCNSNAQRPVESDTCKTPSPIINITMRPSCSDGIQNQGERGVDCEGPCPSVCGEVSPVEEGNVEQELPAGEGVVGGDGSGAISRGVCGDGVCSVAEQCQCAADCGLKTLQCAQNLKTVFFGMIVLALGVLLVVVWFAESRRRVQKEKDDIL